MVRLPGLGRTVVVAYGPYRSCPLYPRLTENIGISFSETTMRPNARAGAAIDVSEDIGASLATGESVTQTPLIVFHSCFSLQNITRAVFK